MLSNDKMPENNMWYSLKHVENIKIKLGNPARTNTISMQVIYQETDEL